jgi:hypothetical protein
MGLRMGKRWKRRGKKKNNNAQGAKEHQVNGLVHKVKKGRGGNEGKGSSTPPPVRCSLLGEETLVEISISVTN